MSPERDSQETARPVRRAGFLLIVLLMLGLPALVMRGLLITDLDLNATVGSQPGGVLRGRLVPRGDWPEGSEGQLGGHALELSTLDLGGGRARVAETISEADGSFRFDAPAVEGRYQVAAGGGLWQRVLREFSFLDRVGQLAPERELELPLRRGCALVVELQSEPKVAGTYDLSGELKEGAILGVLHSTIQRVASFDDGRIEIDGLPPLEGVLRVFYGVGDELSFAVDLEPGETVRCVEL